MKIPGLIQISIAAVCFWFAMGSIFPGAHATSRLWHHLEPLSEAALDAAKVPEERHQRYQEIAAFRKDIENYALEMAAPATKAGIVLFSIGCAQIVLAAYIMTRKLRPNKPVETTETAAQSPRLT